MSASFCIQKSSMCTEHIINAFVWEEPGVHPSRPGHKHTHSLWRRDFTQQSKSCSSAHLLGEHVQEQTENWAKDRSVRHHVQKTHARFVVCVDFLHSLLQIDLWNLSSSKSLTHTHTHRCEVVIMAEADLSSPVDASLCSPQAAPLSLSFPFRREGSQVLERGTPPPAELPSPLPTKRTRSYSE